MLEQLVPMLLTSAKAPPPETGRWAYEVKWDGFRVLTRTGPAGLRVWSRRGTDFSAAFPELGDLPRALDHRAALLDGELVSFESLGRTSFGRIRRRWGPSARRKALQLSRECPATLVVFDVLELDGHRVTAAPYEERRGLLASLRLGDRHWLETQFHVGDGVALLKASREQRLEGLVAKRLGSPYRPGIRSPDWQKLKNYERETFVIGGWIPDGAGRLEALLVGRLDGDRLAYCGSVEFGLDGQRRQLAELLTLIATPDSPFGRGRQTGKVRYVLPRLTARVRFIGWDGPVLREAIFERAAVADCSGG